MILFATPTTPRKFPRPVSLSARVGLVFERQFYRALYAQVHSNKEWKLQRNPWFEYQDDKSGHNVCCPDIILTDVKNDFVIVIEVKQTYIEEAITKLRNLYCPVVYKATGIPATALVVVKNVLPGAPSPASRISFALQTSTPVFQWLGQGPVLL